MFKNYSYQTVPTLPSEDGDPPEPSSPSRDILFDKFRRKQSKSLFLLFFILVTYIIISVIIPRNWIPFEGVIINKIEIRNGSTNVIPSFTESEGNEEIRPIPIQTTTLSDQLVTFSTPKYNDTLTMACKIPKIDPFEHSILPLVHEPRHVDCTRTYPLLFRSTLDSTLVTIGGAGEMHRNVTSCCYQAVQRKGSDSDPDNNYRLSKECTPLSLEDESELAIPPEDEFIAIKCKILNSTKLDESDESSSSSSTPKSDATYSKTMDLHAFVPIKPVVENRIEKYYADLLKRSSDGSRKSAILEKDRVNVVILGIDAVSHANFIRVMPKTHAYLLKEMKAVEMKGFNKMGDNTYPNLAAALTSLNHTALEALCQKDRSFDTCPFIWKQYASSGYRTVYGEDSTWMGIFNYIKKGFKSPPTDYYLRPFGVAAEKLIGTEKLMNARQCYGPRLTFSVLLDYIRKMAFAMGEDKRYFHFTWATSLTHDALNQGRMGDEELRSTLKWFLAGGYLDRTVFILMSDHGIRWGPIHSFLQGKLEERLPFMYFMVPSWFQRKYKKAYENLKVNKDRLTTFYDLHETLVDLIDLGGLDENSLMRREEALVLSLKNGSVPLGISHFLPVPLSRTCEMAGIPEHYCTCHRLKKVSNTQPDVEQAANYIVHDINMMISHYPQCGYLSLESIIIANVIDFGFDVERLKDEQGYELTVVTSPGKAVFEASVMRNKTGVWRVSGSISRTNLYGNQSHCVDDKEIKLYCYCTDNLLIA